MTAAESDFIEQYARTHLLEWCCQTMVHQHIKDVQAAGTTAAQRTVADQCLAFAQEKGWVSKSTPPRVLAKGFSTAAAFLKR